MSISNEYLEQFFVGLLDGKGILTVNFSKETKRLIGRIVIVLENTEFNSALLDKIRFFIGGNVVMERNGKYITWCAVNYKTINKVFIVLEKYPLLTVKKQLQLNFLKQWLFKEDFEKKVFVANRKKIYDTMKNNLIRLNEKEILELPCYFQGWLSGFIESEGKFNLVFNDNGWLKKSSFSIGQQNELHILILIRKYFASKNQISISKKLTKYNGRVESLDYFELKLYNAEFRKLLFEHCKKFPLIGEKKVSYKKFFEYHIRDKN